MIEWIKAQFKDVNTVKDNPYYTKIKKVVLSLDDMRAIKIFYVGGFVYDKVRYRDFKYLTDLESINKFLSLHKYNAQMDNVEIYLIQDSNNQFHILNILDSVELLNGVRALDVYQFSVDTGNIPFSIIFSRQ